MFLKPVSIATIAAVCSRLALAPEPTDDEYAGVTKYTTPEGRYDQDCGLWATARWNDAGKGLRDEQLDVTITPRSCGNVGVSAVKTETARMPT